MDKFQFNNDEKKLLEKYFKGSQKEIFHPDCLLKLEGTFHVTPLPQNPIVALEDGKIDLLIVFPFGYPEYRPPFTIIKEEKQRIFPHVRIENGEICPIESTKWFEKNTLEAVLTYINQFFTDGMNGNLIEKDGFYELPSFPTPFIEGNNPYLVYKIEEPKIWLQKKKAEFGLFSFQVFGPMLKVNKFNPDVKKLSFRDRKGIFIWLPEPPLSYATPPIKFFQLEEILKRHNVSMVDLLDEVFKWRIKSKAALIIIGFPIKVRNSDAESSDVHWQAFTMNLSTLRVSVRNFKGNLSGRYQDALERFKNNVRDKTIFYIHSRDCSRRSLYSRIGGQVNVSSCLVLGCGAIGSNLSFELARSGCDNLGLCDSEWLESGNICRHILDFKSLKKSKATELKKKLQAYNPWGTVEAYNMDLFSLKKESDELKAFLDYEIWVDAGLPVGPSAYFSNFAKTHRKRFISAFISDKAKYFVIVISGKDYEPSVSDLYHRLDEILKEKNFKECRALLSNPENDTRIRPHVGCHFLTFEATGAEMSMVSAILFAVLNELMRDSYKDGRIMVYKKQEKRFSFELIVDEKIKK